MDHIICINQNSFPAINSDVGAELFDNAIQGVLELQTDSDRFLFYLDSNSGCLLDFKIAEDFTYEQFIESCDDDEVASFLLEVQDKSPALDNLSPDQLEEMASYNFYVPNEGVDIFPDVYALAWAVSGYLLSINSNERWNNREIAIARANNEGRFVNEPFSLRNIATQLHGVEHFNELNGVDFEALVSPHAISEPLLIWFSQQTNENKVRIIDKLRLACARNFQGGKPLFDTLIDSNGLREIRFSAYSGGAIRILFKHLEQHRQSLLVGFIKHNNAEGYIEAKRIANELYQRH